tara:strand:+ start:1067 stop:1786 length:720 start_codon:yes stop_codon:yes gene_type:complete
MIKQMMTSAVFAGFVAGLLAALLHFAFLQEYILLAEKYESGELTHFQNAAVAEQPDAVTQSAVVSDAPASTATSTLTRNALTVIFVALVYVGYAMVLVAGFGLAETFGATITAREGLLWGIAGFVSFQIAPGLGLAPELPGVIAAELAQRQMWWWGTVLSTGTGLALLAYGRGYLVRALAILALAAPHVIGAPEADAYSGVTPPEVAAMFATGVLGVAFVAWAVLGWLAGYFWSRQKSA